MAKKKKTTAEKNLKLDNFAQVRDAITKKFGDGALIPLGGDYKIDCEVIPTGSIALDDIIGVGGWPKGRIIEIYGPEGSGKTTLALHAIASTQKGGGAAAFIDAENALDPKYARNLGVSLEDLMLSQPSSGNEALEITELLIASGQINTIVIDSVAALTPREELEGDMNDQQVGAQARMMSKFLRRNMAPVKTNNVVLIFINQLRMKIGMMGYGSPESTPGGKALKFYSSIRADIRKIGTLKDGDDATGHTVKVKLIKNKVATPFRTSEINIIYGKGVLRERELIDLGLKYDVLNRAGSWLSYNEIRIGNGNNAAIEFLMEHPDVAQEIEDTIRGMIINNDDSDIVSEEEVEDIQPEDEIGEE